MNKRQKKKNMFIGRISVLDLNEKNIVVVKIDPKYKSKQSYEAFKTICKKIQKVNPNIEVIGVHDSIDLSAEWKENFSKS